MSQVEITTLGKSCEFFNGKAHEKDIDEKGKYIVVNSKFISSDGNKFKRTNKQMFPLYKDDIVMVMSDVPNGKALAKCFIVDKDDNYSLNQRICCIRSKEFDTKYLYYQLNRHEHFLYFNNGENQTNLRKDDILDCPLIKPSMEEQRRMVVELDELNLKLKQAEENIIRNINNSKEILNGFLEEILKSKSSKWESKKIKDVCTLINGKAYNKSELLTEGKYRVLRVGNFFTNNHWYYSDLELPEDKYCEKGDLLYAWSASFGPRIWIEEKVIYHYHIWKVIPNSDIILKDFLYIIFEWDKEKIKASQGTGTTMIHVSKGSMEERLIPIPTLEEQQIIVKKLNQLQSETIKLENYYKNKLSNLIELKSGVLKRAFENELLEAE